MGIDVRFDRTLDHGRCVAVTIPDETGMPALLERLLPDERAFSASWAPLRRRTFVAGRAALRIALERSALSAPAVLSDDRGAPKLPLGILGSVSHKEHVAVALVAAEQAQGAVRRATRVGVDVEVDEPTRIDIARTVLTADELDDLSGLGEPERAREVKLRFSAKEAIYKAVDPFVRRYVGFQEVTVKPVEDGSAVVHTRLHEGEGPFDVDVRWMRIEGLILTTARITAGSVAV